MTAARDLKELRLKYEHFRKVDADINQMLYDDGWTFPNSETRTTQDSIREVLRLSKAHEEQKNYLLRDREAAVVVLTDAGFAPVDEDDTLHNRVERLVKKVDKFSLRLALIKKALRDSAEDTVQVKIAAILAGDYDDDY